MKISRKQVLAFTGLCSYTITRITKSDSAFPAKTTIGKTDYFEESSFYEWLNSRVVKGANQDTAPTITSTDNIIESSDVQALLNRSHVWIWSNVVKSGKFARVNLSPNPKAKNPRNYFIEREIVAAFSDLIEVREAA